MFCGSSTVAEYDTYYGTDIEHATQPKIGGNVKKITGSLHSFTYLGPQTNKRTCATSKNIPIESDRVVTEHALQVCDAVRTNLGSW
eukprot:CAMPEP_0203777242 /NCGR_PEP_ID=MMETSP0099_2-20121227/7272_1 /ASSEMBLY_ACC=CAM_ASM_000209 /TAXON_ID=96639 /ORGANISM=" , Strain NY0313808BC1" /LENGTH=85 /DNA_ID=CAMNT_0050676497 /DNA_START=1 /DNA_END=255 /DNA_ORIENTATION=+